MRTLPHRVSEGLNARELAYSKHTAAASAGRERWPKELSGLPISVPLGLPVPLDDLAQVPLVCLKVHRLSVIPNHALNNSF